MNIPGENNPWINNINSSRYTYKLELDTLKYIDIEDSSIEFNLKVGDKLTLSNKLAIYKIKSVNQSTNTIEIEEEVIEEEPLPTVTPVFPITYNWGNTVNSYWQGQNEKVLNSLSDAERRKIAGDDGIITADEAKAWQQGMGLSGDLKFGSGTIGAATSKYGNNFNAAPFKGYTNPAKRVPPIDLSKYVRKNHLGQDVSVNPADGYLPEDLIQR